MPAGNHAKPRGPLTSFGPDDVSQPLEIATKVAYANRSVPFRDGLIERFTGDQRFLMGWDPVWRGNPASTNRSAGSRSIAFTAFGSRRGACKESECFLRRLRY